MPFVQCPVVSSNPFNTFASFFSHTNHSLLLSERSGYLLFESQQLKQWVAYIFLESTMIENDISPSLFSIFFVLHIIKDGKPSEHLDLLQLPWEVSLCPCVQLKQQSEVVSVQKKYMSMNSHLPFHNIQRIILQIKSIWKRWSYLLQTNNGKYLSSNELISLP